MHLTLRRRAAIALASALTVVVGVVVISGVGGSHHTRPTTAVTASTVKLPASLPDRASLAAPGPVRLREVPVLRLAHAVVDPSAAAVGSSVLFAAGLDGADASTARVGVIDALGAKTLPALPAAFHDAAGASLDGALYTFGGGDGTAQLDTIRRVDPHGVITNAGTLPAPSSDSAAATIGGTAYIVGGYTGSRWLDTIVAYTPGSGARVVGHLPVAVRYAAVAAVQGRVVVAGGTTPNASATSTVYSFSPATGTVVRFADLPAPISHAGAAAFGHSVVIAGGRDARGPVAGIVAVDPLTRTVRAAGTLRSPRSDAALVAEGGRLFLIGGKTPAGASDQVSRLVPIGPPPLNVYAHDAAGALTGPARAARSLVYVPNSMSNTVDVIDPTTYKVIDHFAVGALPQHVTPSWDLTTLYVDNDRGNSLTPIDPRTGARRGPDIAVDDPYNLYFTPDGHDAIVVAEARHRLDFRDPRTMALRQSVPVPCSGVDHMDFTADGGLALVSCEFSGQMLVVDLHRRTILAAVPLPSRAGPPKPQDVKLSPDGTTFFVADMTAGGVWELNARTFRIDGFLPTGGGAHGLYVSRDTRSLYVTNRSVGTVSVVDFRTRRVTRTWTIPNGSPDMGGVSADGRVLWLSGRYSGVVYAISTTDGRLLATIPVGRGPHGLCVWPQPGRYSVGHTGIMR